eukprot:TRINITY_DN2297_c0_g1_i3.p1 TRINITY_DN2297_c0_g1~~TRINITY_DN2297_c0_g1_i3.p1  ORF type:complete len:281 (+),score=66.83 TRINITY_DN2297_c0_g1_i3:183-1025(+)
MMHNAAVLCIGVHPDNELICTGAFDGSVKVWRIKTGECLQRFDKAHLQGVTSVCFSREGFQVLSSSYDGLLRLHGVKSGKMLREFRGHGSFVNSACVIKDGSKIVSGSSDGSAKIWDFRTTECMFTFVPPQRVHTAETPVNSVQLVNFRQDENVLVCNRSNSLFLINLRGQLLKTFSADPAAAVHSAPAAPQSGKRPIGEAKAAASDDFVTATVSPLGQLVYAATESGLVLVFSVKTGRVDEQMQAHPSDVIATAHHPTRSVVATCGGDATLKVWRPKHL